MEREISPIKDHRKQKRARKDPVSSSAVFCTILDLVSAYRTSLKLT